MPLPPLCVNSTSAVKAPAKGFALALDDKFDDIKKLIDTGKEKGYLTYDEVNDLLPNDISSPTISTIC